MKSPFPSMDPYLETRWQDAHASLVATVSESLQPTLRRDLRSRISSRIDADLMDEVVGRNSPREHPVVTRSMRASARSDLGAPVVLASSLMVRRLPVPVKQKWVQIIDVSSGNRVVTVIEILSPSNKAAGRGNDDYLKKLSD